MNEEDKREEISKFMKNFNTFINMLHDYYTSDDFYQSNKKVKNEELTHIIEVKDKPKEKPNYQKKYYDAHKDKIKQYYKDHKDDIIQKQKERDKKLNYKYQKDYQKRKHNKK
jgi:hypothetical protein